MRPAALAALALAELASTAAAQPMIRAPAATDTLAIVTHVDVLPDHMTAARDALAAYVRAARGEPGALRVEAMQEVRQNHFDLVETWRDEAAWRAHQASAASLELRRTVGPWLGSPIDERIGTPLHQ